MIASRRCNLVVSCLADDSRLSSESTRACWAYADAPTKQSTNTKRIRLFPALSCSTRDTWLPPSQHPILRGYCIQARWYRGTCTCSSSWSEGSEQEECHLCPTRDCLF